MISSSVRDNVQASSRGSAPYESQDYHFARTVARDVTIHSSDFRNSSSAELN